MKGAGRARRRKGCFEWQTGALCCFLNGYGLLLLDSSIGRGQPEKPSVCLSLKPADRAPDPLENLRRNHAAASVRATGHQSWSEGPSSLRPCVPQRCGTRPPHSSCSRRFHFPTGTFRLLRAHLAQEETCHACFKTILKQSCVPLPPGRPECTPVHVSLAAQAH